MSLDITNVLRAQGDLIPFQMEVDAIGASRDDMELTIAQVSGQATGLGEQIALIGTIHVEGEARCARCTKPFITSFDAPLDATFQRKGEEGAGFEEEEDPDVDFYEGSRIELKTAVESALSLHMPMRFLCEEECKGLCPTCGQNLNEAACDCVPSGEDSPFAALGALLNDEKEVDPHGSPEG